MAGGVFTNAKSQINAILMNNPAIDGKKRAIDGVRLPAVGGPRIPVT